MKLWQWKYCGLLVQKESNRPLLWRRQIELHIFGNLNYGRGGYVNDPGKEDSSINTDGTNAYSYLINEIRYLPKNRNKNQIQVNEIFKYKLKTF